EAKNLWHQASREGQWPILRCAQNDMGEYFSHAMRQNARRGRFIAPIADSSARTGTYHRPTNLLNSII
ncbi:MAG TPA: hypothetical protein VJ761_18925, partial [Ktedonobacteraceae bacterium]|nr:hypothetical protein [Ktedonobacteraceae bacterium]